MYETIITTNSELFKNEVKAAVSNEPKSSLSSSSQSLVKLCPGFDPINVLFGSQVNVNASGACVLVSRIVYGVKMTVPWKGSDCLNAENACSDHGIWTWILISIWTICLGSEMKMHGDHLSFERDLLDLFRHDEDP